MLSFLPGPVKGALLLLLYTLNTLFWFALIFPVGMAKLLVPVGRWRLWCSLVLKRMAAGWVAVNRISTRLVNRVEWDVQGLEGLDKDQWYLVLANHQSWTDILVLQTVFYGRIPFLKFFLKKNLIYMPFLGFAWWALDFPFMRRYSQAFLQKHPHLAGKDLETTKLACRKFRKMPVSVMNFVEGTRFTPAKHARQESPHANLLRPKAGGVAFTLAAMQGSLNRIVNVTIAYPSGKTGLWDFVCGRVTPIVVRVSTIPITSELCGDYFADERFRENFQDWLNGLWTEKDREIRCIKEGFRPRG
ncbi:MAG: acyltransferase [Thermodesulfobacteriota bacterium]